MRSFNGLATSQAVDADSRTVQFLPGTQHRNATLYSHHITFSICVSLRVHVVPVTPNDGCLQAIPFALLHDDFGYFNDVQAGLHGTPDPVDYQFTVSH